MKHYVKMMLIGCVLANLVPSEASADRLKVLGAFVAKQADGVDVKNRTGIRGVKRAQTGLYVVRFNQKVDTCLPSATLFFNGNKIAAQTSTGQNQKDEVTVIIQNDAGQFVDDAFWIVVNCPN